MVFKQVAEQLVAYVCHVLFKRGAVPFRDDDKFSTLLGKDSGGRRESPRSLSKLFGPLSSLFGVALSIYAVVNVGPITPATVYAQGELVVDPVVEAW